MGCHPRVMHVLSGLTGGGAETNTVRLSNALADRGWQQVVVTLTPEIDPHLRSLLRVPLHYPPQARRFVGGAAILADSIRDFQPGVIHGRAYRTWAECITARITTGSDAKLVQSFHGATSLDIQVARRRVMAWFMHGLTDTFAAVSHDLARRMTEQWQISAERIQVVPNGVDVDRFHPPTCREEAKRVLGIDPGAFAVGSVGSLREVKNQGMLLRAFAGFAAAGGSNVLLLVGDGPMRGDLESLAQDLGIGDQTMFCGRQGEVARYLSAMDVFVQPSLKEGSPTAVLEAMACGIPTVAVRSTGCAELHEQIEQPLLVDPDDIESLQELLSDLADDADRRRELGEGGRQAVIHKFSFERMVEAYEDLYRRTAAAEVGQPLCVRS